MKKIKAAVHVFTQSLASPKYYNKLLKTDFKFSIKYYAVLSVIFAIVTATFILIPLIPKISQNINEGIDYALALYEDDLVITVKEGQVSINKEEPYIIPFPGRGGEGPTNLIVFDSEGTLEDLDRTYDTFILVNDANILLRTDNETTVYPVDRLPDGTFNKENLIILAEQMRNFAKFVPYIFSVVLFLAVLVYYLGIRLVYLLFVALFLWIVGALKGLKLTYAQYYRVALHSMTLPMVVELVHNLSPLNFPALPWFLVLNLVFGIWVVFSLNYGLEADGDSFTGQEDEEEVGEELDGDDDGENVEMADNEE